MYLYWGENDSIVSFVKLGKAENGRGICIKEVAF